jgi:hypothetical protein
MTAPGGGIGATPGHHELAWELLDEGRSNLDDLIAELSQVPHRWALVSSEDFSLLYARPAGLAMLRDGLASIGYTAKIVLYLRAQASYAESMYGERIKHGHVRSIDFYLQRIVDQGYYLPDGTQQNIAFEYTRLIAPFVEVFGAGNVAVRAYVPSDDATWIFRDFLSAAGRLEPDFSRTPMQLQIASPRENEGLSFVNLLGTLHAQLQPGVPLPSDAMEFAGRYAPELSKELALARYSLLQRDEYVNLLQRFERDNREIERLFGAHVPFASEADVRPKDDPMWEKAQLERSIFDRCLAAWMGAPSGHK